MATTRGKSTGHGSTGRKSGFAMVYLHLAMVVTLAGFVSVAADMGHVQMVKGELQNAADAAARAACAALSSGTTAATTAAQTIAGSNYADGTAVALNTSTDVQFGTWDPSARKFTQLTGSAAANANSVRVFVSRTSAKGNGVSLTWARLLGQNTCDVHVKATGCSTGSSGQQSLIGLNGITITGNGYTDSYNATKGAYNAAAANKNGSIASNGDITLSNFAKVNGDVRPGVGKSATLNNSASVTGMIAPVASNLSYPSATLPGSYTDLGDVNMSSGTSYIAGGNYVIHNLTLSGTAHIVWQGPVNLYITSSYNVSQSVVIDTYQNLPANRILYFLPTCATANWTGTNDNVGEMYAPDTVFNIGGSVDLYGRVTAKTINLSSGGGMHYDESLAPPGGTTSRPSISLVN